MALDDIDINYGNTPGGSGSYVSRSSFMQPTGWNPNIDQRMADALMSPNPNNPASYGSYVSRSSFMQPTGWNTNIDQRMADALMSPNPNNPASSGSYVSRASFMQPTDWNPNIDQRMADALMSPNPNNPASNTSPGLNNQGLTEQPVYGTDVSTQNYVRGSVGQALRNTMPNEVLSAQDLYPLGNEPVEVGQFSGPLFSGSVYSAGAPEIPYEMLYAKQRARAAEDAVEEAKRNRQITWNIAQTKDALHNDIFVEQQNKDWTSWVNGQIENIKKNTNISPADYYDVVTNSQAYKEKTFKWNNVANAYDDVFDWAAQTKAYKNEQSIPGYTVVKKRTEKEKEAGAVAPGGKKTVAGAEQYEQEYDSERAGAVAAADVPYVSDGAYDVANRFFTEIQRSEVDIDRLSDIMNEMQYAKSMDKIINEFADVQNANVTSELMKAKADGRWITTDKSKMYEILKGTGVKNPRSPEMKEKIREVYDSQYKYIEPKFRPDFEREFYPQQVNALIYKEDIALSNVDQYDPFRYTELEYREKKDNLEKVTVSMTEEKSLINPGKVDQVWSIPKNKQAGKTVWIASGTTASIYDPVSRKVTVREIPEGYYKPSAIRKDKSTGDVTMDYIPVQQVPTIGKDGKPVRDQNGKTVMQWAENQNYSVNAPYSLGKSAVENAGDLDFENDPTNVIPYTQRGGQAQQLKVGTVQDGYRFKGGDPSKQENWEEVK